jgi:hypothetical protein
MRRIPEKHIAGDSHDISATRSGVRLSTESRAFQARRNGGVSMKYILAWLLGIPGGLILLWFLFNQM